MPNIILLYLFTGKGGVSQVFNVVNDLNHFTVRAQGFSRVWRLR